MRFRIITISLMTVFLLVVPAFLVHIDDIQPTKPEQQSNVIEDENKPEYTPETDQIKTNDSIQAFSSQTCYKKTYYINKDKVYVYSDSSGNGKPEIYLQADTPVVGLKENNGYIYCEINNGMKGWIKLDKDNFKIVNITKEELNEKEKSDYFIEVSVSNQNIEIYKQGRILKEISCSTGKLGDSDTETPLGVFKIQNRNTYFYNKDYNEGAKYYVQFFANYLIHSVPVDKDGKVIEEESIKLGNPASHGCIRVSMEEAKWIYDNIPQGTEVYIHY